jgi:hypothetical protein
MIEIPMHHQAEQAYRKAHEERALAIRRALKWVFRR